MAAINRPTEATYEIHEEVSVETSDNEDHHFCGIMFPVKCKDNLPLDHVVIKSVAVRGELGPITVWVSNDPPNNQEQEGFRMHPRYWTKIFNQKVPASRDTFKTLALGTNSIILKPGKVRAIYIHSTRRSDDAIVYDNTRNRRRTYDDNLVSILTGRAHVSTEPFGTQSIWGWGNPWRDQREFVGCIEYGAVYKLWNPWQNHIFGTKFQNMARVLFLCQRRWESPFSSLPDDVIFYILNMCRWDWAEDSAKDMKALKKKRARAKAAADEAAEVRAVASAAAAPPAEDSKPPAQKGFFRKCAGDDDDDEDEEKESHQARDEEDSDASWISDDAHDDDDDDISDDDDDGYFADDTVFRYREDDSDEEDHTESENASRQACNIFSRSHVVQALAALHDEHFAMDEV